MFGCKRAHFPGHGAVPTERRGEANTACTHASTMCFIHAFWAHVWLCIHVSCIVCWVRVWGWTVYAIIYIYTHTNCMHIHKHMYIRMHIHMPTYMGILSHVRSLHLVRHTCIYAHKHSQTHSHTHIYTHDIHTHTHTHAWTSRTACTLMHAHTRLVTWLIDWLIVFVW